MPQLAVHEVNKRIECISGGYVRTAENEGTSAVEFVLRFPKPAEYLVEFQSTAFGQPDFIGARMTFETESIATSAIFSNSAGVHRLCALGHAYYKSDGRNQEVTVAIKPLTDSSVLNRDDNYFIRITRLTDTHGHD